MVSSFSNPGFPPVDVHPTRLPAMDARLSAAIDSFEASMRAALRDAIREALDSAFANFTTNFSRDWALLRRDSALRAEGVSDPVPTTSDDTQSIDLGHTGLQGDDNPPRLPSPVQVHSVPPLLSSSPLLRALATPVVKPQSIASDAAIVSLLGSKTVIPDSVMTTASQLLPDCSASMFSNLCKFSGNEFTPPTFFRKSGAEFMKAQPSMIAHKCQQGLVGMYARYVFDEIPDSCCCVVLDRDMCYCKGIQDKGGGSKFRSPDECRRKLEEKIAKSDYDVSIGCFITKKLHVWCQLPRVLWIRRHEVLRSLIYNLSHGEAKWYWILLFILAYYTGVIVILYEDSLTEKCGWVNWYLVGKFVKKNFYALQLFDRLSKRGSANVHVLYVASLDMHDLEASPKLDGSSSKPRVKEVSSAENDNVSHIEIKIIEYHGSDEKCVLRYLNLSDNAMGNYGVNAFESLLSSQNNLRELYLMNMARLNMCHNTREWHRDVIRKIKWLYEKGISIMIDTQGQGHYEDFSDYIKTSDDLTFKLLLYFQAVNAKGFGFTKFGSTEEAKTVVGNMNDVAASTMKIKEMEQGLTSLIVLGNGRLSDLIAQLQDILGGVNEADILPGKFDSAVIRAQIQQLAQEFWVLTSSGPITIYNESSSSSGNYASYLVPVVVLAAMGYRFHDFIFTILVSDARFVKIDSLALRVFDERSHSGDCDFQLGYHMPISDTGGTLRGLLTSNVQTKDAYKSKFLICTGKFMKNGTIVHLKLGFHEFILDKGGTTIQRLLNSKSIGKVEIILVQENASAQLFDALQLLEEVDLLIVPADQTRIAPNVFDEISDSSCCVVVHCAMCYCKGIRDKSGGSKFWYTVISNMHFSCLNESGNCIECSQDGMIGVVMLVAYTTCTDVGGVFCSTYIALSRAGILEGGKDIYTTTFISGLLNGRRMMTMTDLGILKHFLSEYVEQRKLGAAFTVAKHIPKLGDLSLLVENTSAEQLGLVRKVTIFTDSGYHYW